MKSFRGFTLIEMMITVAIVAILAAIAVPSYSAYIQRGKIVEAQTALSDLRTKMEQWYQDRRTYLDASGTSTVYPCGDANVPKTKYFGITCSTVAANAYLLNAAGKSGTDMASHAFTIDQSGGKQTTGFPGVSGLPQPCWLAKAGDSC